MPSLNEDEITAMFKTLVSEEIIMYGPHTSVRREDSGYPMELRICPSLARKPHTITAKLDSKFDQSRKWGEGSDLYLPDSRLIIAHPNNTHDLAFNMFAVDVAQLLMPTSDSFKRQDDPLDRDDFDAMLTVLNELNNFYFIYNCSEKGGCSRYHKHMQGLRGPPYAFDVLVEAWESGDFSRVPYKYFAHHFQPGFKELRGEDVLGVYKVLVGKTRDVLGLGEKDICPHNVGMWRDWIFVIPRTNSAVGKASGNAASMLGSVWLSSESLLEEWNKVGWANVLRKLGFPSSGIVDV